MLGENGMEQRSQEESYQYPRHIGHENEVETHGAMPRMPRSQLRSLTHRSRQDSNPSRRTLSLVQEDYWSSEVTPQAAFAMVYLALYALSTFAFVYILYMKGYYLMCAVCGSFFGIVFITAAHTYGITMKDDSLLTERRTLGTMSGRVHLMESIEWQLMMEDRDFDSNDYERLLQLDALNVGLFEGASQAEINRLPTMKLCSDHIKQNGETSCLICLQPLAVNDDVRVIPCFHKFHTSCIDKWLGMKAKCPVCKFSALS